MKTDGKFIFDIHTPKKMKNMIDNQVFAYETDEISYLWFAYGTGKELEVESELTFFIKQKNGLYRRLEQFHTQRTYEIEDISSAAKEIGFKINKYFCDFELDNKDYENADRIIFILEK